MTIQNLNGIVKNDYAKSKAFTLYRHTKHLISSLHRHTKHLKSSHSTDIQSTWYPHTPQTYKALDILTLHRHTKHLISSHSTDIQTTWYPHTSQTYKSLDILTLHRHTNHLISSHSTDIQSTWYPYLSRRSVSSTGRIYNVTDQQPVGCVTQVCDGQIHWDFLKVMYSLQICQKQTIVKPL